MSLKSDIQGVLQEIVKSELGKEKFKKSISKFSKSLEKKINRSQNRKVKIKPAKVWKK